MFKAGLYASGVSALGFLLFNSFLEENPLTHKKRLLLWGPSLDIRIGKWISNKKKEMYVLQKIVVGQDTATHKVAFGIAKELLRNWPDEHKRNWNLTVIREKLPNAFVSPDGSIFVTTQLVEIANTVDELALVLGHEIGHVYLRHSTHRISTDVPIRLILSLVQFILFGENYSIVNHMQYLMLFLPMSRQAELEADLFGLQLMSKIGFDSNNSPAIFEKLKELSPEMVPWLSTHPATEDRLKELKLEIMKLKDVTMPKEQKEKRKKMRHLDAILLEAKKELAKNTPEIESKPTELLAEETVN